MDGFLVEYADRLTDQFLNPKKRVFIGYLSCALVLAMGVQLIGSKSTLRRAAADIFSKNIWWSRSARTDYLIAVLNQAIMMGLIPRLISSLAVASLLFGVMHTWFGGRPVVMVEIPDWTIAALFTVVLFLMEDGTKYLVHRCLHTWPLFWCFHKVHHTAETLTPFTVYRTHPVEGVLFALRAILVQAVALATFFFFLGDRVELITVFGANVILFGFNVAGSNLRHSHIWLSYGHALEHVLISPAQHQIHHSVERYHLNRNFGAVLAIWDWMGGSLCLSARKRQFHFGIEDAPDRCHSLTAAYLTPFWEALTCLKKMFLWRPNKMNSLRDFRLIRRGGAATLIVMLAIAIEATVFGASAKDLNIYSHRQPFLINPFIEAYQKLTGTKINIVFASKGLAQRLQAEGPRSPADVVLTVDIARLFVYADKGLLASIDSDVLRKNIPPRLRDPNNRWFAFSKRARVIVVSRDAHDASSIRRYEDLVDTKWKGRICARPGSHVYNRALIASFIEAEGESGAQKWAQGIVDNLARRPQGNDRGQVKAIYEGVCDIAIINNYYYGKLKSSDIPEQRDWASAIRLIFPNQEDRGTHVNISGGGVAKHSKNKEEAIRFLEFLTSKAAQNLYGSINYEYPVNPTVEPSAELQSWGVFKEDQMPIARIAELAPQAQQVIDRVGW
jgi:iron(III) transport system substrate-binding protein